MFLLSNSYISATIVVNIKSFKMYSSKDSLASPFHMCGGQFWKETPTVVTLKSNLRHSGPSRVCKHTEAECELWGYGTGQVGMKGNYCWTLPSFLCKMAPGGAPPPPLPSPSSSQLATALPQALAHKSAVVYENLQHSDLTLRPYSSLHWPQPFTWRRSREHELFMYDFQ